MANYHFRDKNMSLKAKGLLSLMLSLPDEWDYSVRGLAALSKDGKDSVMNTLTELEEFGYLKRSKLCDDGGRFAGYYYDIYEKPCPEKPCPGKPDTEKPDAENPPQLSTKESSTKKSITNTDKYEEILSSVSDNGLRDLYLEYIKMRKLIKSPMTDKALTMLIQKVNSLEPGDIDRQKLLLETAIINNWKSVYPLKDNQRGRKEPVPGWGPRQLGDAETEALQRMMQG